MFIIDTLSDIYSKESLFALREVYAEGLGLINKHLNSFEGYSCTSLLGYHSSTDTLGIIVPRNVLLNQNDILEAADFELEVYPNPSHTTANINITTSKVNDLLQLEIIDWQGKILRSETISPFSTHQFSTTSLNQGVYLIYIKDNKGQSLGLKKLVIAR